MQWTGLETNRAKSTSELESKVICVWTAPPGTQERPQPAADEQRAGPYEEVVFAQRSRPRHRVTTRPEVHPHSRISSAWASLPATAPSFEMLGNFSFQDYFKDEVIPWAWEFLTSDEWMAIPKDRLHISVYEEDDEACDIWTKKVGIAPDHMVRLGGDITSGSTAPAVRPRSEIYFDRGPEYGCRRGADFCGVGCDCDRCYGDLEPRVQPV